MKVRDFLYDLYLSVEKRIAPGLRYSQNIFEDILEKKISKDCSWLDLGCGHHLLPPWRYEQEKKLVKKPSFLVGLDYDYLSLTKHMTVQNRIRGDIACLPFKSESFDIVSSNMVFEHLQEPQKQLEEIYRILKPGGRLLFHTPNAKGYATILARITPGLLTSKILYILQGREEEDVFPTFFKINTPDTIKFLGESVGFIAEDIQMLASNAQFAVALPIAIVELFWIKLTMTNKYRNLRTNIVATLLKPI